MTIPLESGGTKRCWTMQVLQDCINHVTNIKGVKITTKYLASRTNLDVEDLKGVDAVIVECSSVDSTPNRTNPLFPALPPAAPPPPPPAAAAGDNAPRDGAPPGGARRGGGGQGGGRGGAPRRYDAATLAYFNELDNLHKAGMGVMILHWGIQANIPQIRDIYLRWFGQTSMDGYTQNPLGYWKVTPIESGKNHPVMRGVGPWVYQDEIFSRLMVNPGDPYRTDLLMGESPQTNQSEDGSPKGVISPRGIASVYEKGKERGVLWGGMDFHSALLNENYLRFVLNEIVWVAGIEVPEGGVKTSATKLNLVPISHQFGNQIKPEGYVEPKMPDAQ